MVCFPAIHFPYFARLLDNMGLETFEFVFLLVLLSVGWWLFDRTRNGTEDP